MSMGARGTDHLFVRAVLTTLCLWALAGPAWAQDSLITPIPDSPDYYTYSYNTYTELGWIEMEIPEHRGISDWYITFTWTTNWAEMGRFYALSPSGTQFTIINGDPSGTYEIDTAVFDGEPADGTWRLWIVDDDFNCDASHRATDITMFIIPPPPGDLDGDQEVDLDDFGLFAECLAGPDVTTPPPGCDPMTFDLANLDDDNDTDLADFAVFQPLLSGLWLASLAPMGVGATGVLTGRRRCWPGLMFSVS